MKAPLAPVRTADTLHVVGCMLSAACSVRITATALHAAAVVARHGPCWFVLSSEGGGQSPSLLNSGSCTRLRLNILCIACGDLQPRRGNKT